MEGLTRLLTFPAGRRAKWLVLALWVVVIGALSPYSAEFESVQENDQSSFLPGDAQSTRAVGLARRFERDPRLPAIVVYRREGALTPADRRRAQEDQRAILGRRLPGVVPAPVPPQVSPDGKAQLLVVPMRRARTSRG